jgi:hypothetical protein
MALPAQPAAPVTKMRLVSSIVIELTRPRRRICMEPLFPLLAASILG